MFQNRLDQFHDTFFNSEYFYMEVNWEANICPSAVVL